MPEKPVCGPSEAPLAPMLCRLPVWKLFLRTAPVKALHGNGFSAPRKMTFKGAAAHGFCPAPRGKCIGRVPVQNLLITWGPIMGPLPYPRPTAFLRLVQEQHKHSNAQPGKKTSALKCGPGSLGPRGSIRALQALSTPPARVKYLFDLICISFSEMHLSLGLNKLSGRNRKSVNFRRYRTAQFRERPGGRSRTGS